MAAAPISSMTTPPAPPALSEGSRIVNTFIAPSKTFTDLRRSSSWRVPWLLISIFSLISIYAMERQIGFEQVTKNSIAHSSKAEQFDKLPADQQAKQIQVITSFTRYFSWGIPLVNLIVFVIVAAVLMATFNLVLSAGVPYKTALAIVIYAGLPQVISAVLGIISMFSGVDPGGFNAQNPVATNPAYFMDPAGSKFAYTMASALDVFVIWSIILTGIGFACNSKVKRSTAIAVVAGCYFLYKLVGAAFASM